ncbi:protein FAR-RED IMPAIRED RESPONSE 1-like [Vigna radiata var. radiata]|uniref:Protein FAR-RED IMPAIRED RESPONSE 1-like n=1 Tax=Vigna radiata var. radiata TaxID=3916 RepID=A0A1S3TSD5_VIGRR|nr:protein FAR-RED IMPAIRED RESPONSE 1-like [Vigna radiata var. radiata]
MDNRTSNMSEVPECNVNIDDFGMIDSSTSNINEVSDCNVNLDEHTASGLEVDPTLHMCFDSMDDAKNFYKNYAIRCGFAVRTRTSKKDDYNNVIYLRLVCSREGKYVSSINPEVKTLPSQTNQCPAGITISKKDDKWFIRTVNLNHNHELCPNTSKLIPGNRKLSMQAKRTLEVNDEAEVRINKSYLCVMTDAGGYDSMDFIERDARNYISQHKRSLCKDGDGQALLRHFSAMKDLNKEFFYKIELDEGNRICSVFWADARSRAACEEFGDVVCFNTTYLTNKYDMPFMPFVGINHHGHSILLGCGLLSSEDTRSFVWLFQSWLRCISNKAPKGIITDQCRAMANAIEEVFSNTRHRWCLWHIMKKLLEKFSAYKEYNHIKSAINKLVYDCGCVADFESGWEALLSRHGLHQNEWLCTMYDERQKWVPCFLRNHFWAGMSITQRSEGMNAFFDGFINSSTTLQQFVAQYDNALRVKAQKEIQADFSSLNTTVGCGSQSPIERQFQQEYTHSKFEEVQMEFRSRMNCFIKETFKDNILNTYTVKEEWMGIICRHSLLVFGQEDVCSVPSKYVLRRWSKNIRRRHTLIRAAYINSNLEPTMQRYQSLCKTFYEIAEVACESEPVSNELEKELRLLRQKFGCSLMMTNNIVSDGGELRYDNAVPNFVPETVGEGVDLLVRNPVAVKRKGRPHTNRMKSAVEKRTKKGKSASTQKTSRTSVEECGTRLPNVGQTQDHLQFETQGYQCYEVSQQSNMNQSGFMSLLNAVHNNFDDNIV